RHLVHACSFFYVVRKSCVVAVCERLHGEIVVKLVGEVGNWKIVAHIAFKFYSVASGTFSTGSTFAVRRVPLAAHRSRRRGWAAFHLPTICCCTHGNKVESFDRQRRTGAFAT